MYSAFVVVATAARDPGRGNTFLCRRRHRADGSHPLTRRGGGPQTISRSTGIAVPRELLSHPRTWKPLPDPRGEGGGRARETRLDGRSVRSWSHGLAGAGSGHGARDQAARLNHPSPSTCGGWDSPDGSARTPNLASPVRLLCHQGTPLPLPQPARSEQLVHSPAWKCHLN